MFDAYRRPSGRLFCLLAFLLVLPGASWSQTPATTTVSARPVSTYCLVERGWRQQSIPRTSTGLSLQPRT